MTTNNTHDIFARLNTDEGQRVISQERLMVQVTEEIARAMNQKNISRTDLADRMQVTPARVSQILSGDSNLTLRTIADVFHALNVELSLATNLPRDQWSRFKVVPTPACEAIDTNHQGWVC